MDCIGDCAGRSGRLPDCSYFNGMAGPSQHNQIVRHSMRHWMAADCECIEYCRIIDRPNSDGSRLCDWHIACHRLHNRSGTTRLTRFTYFICTDPSLARLATIYEILLHSLFYWAHKMKWTQNNLWLQAWSLRTQKEHLWHGEWLHGCQSFILSFPSYLFICLCPNRPVSNAMWRKRAFLESRKGKKEKKILSDTTWRQIRSKKPLHFSVECVDSTFHLIYIYLCVLQCGWSAKEALKRRHVHWNSFTRTMRNLSTR